jgi:tetraacyldisaccharide-1-P 4'-kinase
VEHWYRRGAVAWLLWPASLVFGLAVVLRNMNEPVVAANPDDALLFR